MSRDELKKGVRRKMRAQNRSLTPDERQSASERLCEQLATIIDEAEVQCVALYAALGDEPESRPLIERLYQKGVRVALPRVEGEVMRFFYFAPERVASGAFGIEEPTFEAELCRPDEIELMVVPGVAFTPQGERLGRGRGYYDKYLAQCDFRGRTVGVCYRHQLCESLPTEPHDIKMEQVVTS
ncbi:MAG: 5-formyltetrahydrofolate cyclo-ligase [Alistipes sp.]|nr:5-formyltetrahydrofolate cyclo-ligase [Alistipes sp.]